MNTGPIGNNDSAKISAPRIFIVIPVYNEDPGILSSVINKLKYLEYTIVVVDDGSPRSVADILANEPVIVLTHQVNLGQGAALQTGIDYAKMLEADIVVTFDADGQHSAADIKTLIEPLLKNEVDIVLGSRFLITNLDIPLPRKIVLQLARGINFLFTGILLTDAHNGLRALGKQALEKITITENRMAHASEILFEIKKQRLKFIEVPVSIEYSPYAKKKGQSAWDSIKVLFDLILHKLFK